MRGLSGGQKVKVVLAAATWMSPHIIVLVTSSSSDHTPQKPEQCAQHGLCCELLMAALFQLLTVQHSKGCV